MQPRLAILILIILAISGSAVLGFIYFVKINSPIIVENDIILDENKETKKENDLVYEEGTEEYFQYLIDEMNKELVKEKKENGFLSEESKRESIELTNTIAEKKYQLLSEKEKESFRKLMIERQKLMDAYNLKEKLDK